MANSDILEDDDFEKLLDSFINDSIDNEPNNNVSAAEKINQMKNADSSASVDDDDDDDNDDIVDYTTMLSAADQSVN